METIELTLRENWSMEMEMELPGEMLLMMMMRGEVTNNERLRHPLEVHVHLIRCDGFGMKSHDGVLKSKRLSVLFRSISVLLL